MNEAAAPPRLIVAITGATGAIFGVRALQRLLPLEVERHVIITTWGARTIEHETSYRVADVEAMGDVVHKSSNQAATVSSGSFPTEGMLVAPCSVKSLAAIATGLANDLVARAADVVLKERRRLVLMVREAPLSELHLENMLRLSRMGAVVLPPVPAFYNSPETIDDLVDHVVTRALDQLGFRSDETPRWDGVLRRREHQSTERDV